MVKPTSNQPPIINAAAALFFSNTNQPARNGAAAGKNSSSNNINRHAEKEEDPDFKELVSQLKKTANKMPLKKQWKRKKAHWSSEKINEWWARAVDCAKEAATNTSINSSTCSNEQSSSHSQQQEMMMIQALSAAVAKLGEDKKNDPEILRETVKEQKILLLKQCKSSISINDFKLLWKSAWARVAEIHGIVAFKRRNSSEQQQQQVGARKPPPEVANAIAAAAKAAAAAAGNDDDKDNDALAGPPIKKRKKMVDQHQQHPNLENNDSMRISDRNKVSTSTNAFPTRTAAASSNPQVSSSGNQRRTKVEPRDNNIDKPGVETIVIDDDSDDDDDDASCVQQHQQPEPPLTPEQLRFQKMVQDIEDESAAGRHVPLQVILKKHRQEWENHLVSQGPMAKRLSKNEFASLWDRVEHEACENWTQRVHQSTSSPMDWSFLVFGKHYDAKKATEYFHGWDTMARASP